MSTARVSPFVQDPASASPPVSSTSTGERDDAHDGGAVGRLWKLNALLDLPCFELERRYNDARAPRLGDVAGDLHGRCWPGRRSRCGPTSPTAIRAFAGSSAFPWRGKSFHPKTESRGDGINRVLSDRLRLFRFETFIGPSKAGDFDALQLDYDLPGNPPVIRSIKDEIRALEPGLWLGQAYLKTRTRDILWLYFALARVDA